MEKFLRSLILWWKPKIDRENRIVSEHVAIRHVEEAISLAGERLPTYVVDQIMKFAGIISLQLSFDCL